MKTSVKRRISLALGLSLVGAIAALPVTPATAVDTTTVSCQTLLSTTPGIEVDLNNDGNPEFRAPRIYDVTLCSEATYGYTTYPPTTESCSDIPKGIDCRAVRITVLPAYAGARAEGEVCASVEGFGRSCLPFDSGTWDWAAPNTICVGYDLGGGHPCDGSLIAFE